MSNRPIGFFDSGVGGLSVWKEVKFILPKESTLYLADSANAPYGKRSKTEITQLCVKNTEILIQHNCKAIVVACNTATTNAISHLRSRYTIPFIGVEPAIKPASLSTKTGCVGVLATSGTLVSDLFAKTTETHTKHISLITQKGDDLVELIEQGKADSEAAKRLLRTYLQPMIAQHIDVLVLGCTHFPFLLHHIREILPTTTQVIDSAYGVAKQTKAVLEANHLLENANPTEYTFYTNKKLPPISTFIPEFPVAEFQMLDF